MRRKTARNFLAGLHLVCAQAEDARNRSQRGFLHPGKFGSPASARKSVPPHVANAVQRPRFGFAQMRWMRGAVGNEKLREQGSNRFDTASAVLDRHIRRIESRVVAGGAGADQIG